MAEALAKGAGKAWSEEDAERASGLLSTVEALDGARPDATSSSRRRPSGSS